MGIGLKTILAQKVFFYSNLFWSEHLLRSDPLVELFRGQVSELDGLLLQGRPVLVSRLRDLRGLEGKQNDDNQIFY